MHILAYFLCVIRRNNAAKQQPLDTPLLQEKNKIQNGPQVKDIRETTFQQKKNKQTGEHCQLQ